MRSNNGVAERNNLIAVSMTHRTKLICFCKKKKIFTEFTIRSFDIGRNNSKSSETSKIMKKKIHITTTATKITHAKK